MLVENQNKNNSELNTWSLYLFALKSPVTREKYQTRLDKFFKFIGLDGKTVEDKSINFITLSKIEGNQWVFNSILKFMQFHLERVNRKEITVVVFGAGPVGYFAVLSSFLRGAARVFSVDHWPSV